MVLWLSPLYRVDANIHRQCLGQSIVTGEVQVDALLTTYEAIMRVHIPADGVLITEVGPVALKSKKTKHFKHIFKN